MNDEPVIPALTSEKVSALFRDSPVNRLIPPFPIWKYESGGTPQFDRQSRSWRLPGVTDGAKAVAGQATGEKEVWWMPRGGDWEYAVRTDDTGMTWNASDYYPIFIATDASSPVRMRGPISLETIEQTALTLATLVADYKVESVRRCLRSIYGTDGSLCDVAPPHTPYNQWRQVQGFEGWEVGQPQHLGFHVIADLGLIHVQAVPGTPDVEVWVNHTYGFTLGGWTGLEGDPHTLGCHYVRPVAA